MRKDQRHEFFPLPASRFPKPELNWFIRLVRSHFVIGIALGLTFGMCMPLRASSSPCDPPDGDVEMGSIVIVGGGSITPATPVIPTYVLPPIHVVDLGNPVAAMSQAFAEVWGLPYDNGNCALRLEGIQNGVGTLVAADQREADPIVGQTLVLIHESIPVNFLASLNQQAGVVSQWSVISAEIIGINGVIYAVGLQTRITSLPPGNTAITAESLAAQGAGIFTITAVVPSVAASVSAAIALASGLEELGQAPDPLPAPGPAWDGFPTQKACITHAGSTYNDCIAQAFRSRLSCGLQATAGVVLALAACIALAPFGALVCAAFAVIAQLLLLAACSLQFQNAVALCNQNFVNYARTACGVIILPI